jgi:hypothetical protein
MQEVIAIQIDEGRALVWFPHSDLTLEGKECSDILYFCIELPFSATIVIPRNLFDISTTRWSSRGVICELTGASELQKKHFICSDKEDGSATRVDFDRHSGVERIELLKTPQGFEPWSKVSPLSLKADTTGLFGQ